LFSGRYKNSIPKIECVEFEMARPSIVAAGGIVLRRQQPPLIAVVRLRKRDEWVLPKGKLDQGETPRAAAKREVLEETGHHVTMHEFLGTLVYDVGGRSKIVHYWRMEAAPEQTRELMSDVRAVDWLPLEAAVSRLSRASERAFLGQVGPLALTAFARRLKAKAPAATKRRRQATAITKPAIAEPLPVEPVSAERVADARSPQAVPAAQPQASRDAALIAASDMAADRAIVPENDAVVVAETPVVPTPPEIAASEPESPAGSPISVTPDDAVMSIAPDEPSERNTFASDQQRRSLAQKVRDWLGGAA
jgi:8-oxo-dGTP diphosphatase